MPSRPIKQSRKKTFKTFIEDMKELPKIFKRGQEREKKALEEFRKKKK